MMKTQMLFLGPPASGKGTQTERLSKELGLPTWAKPSFACLSTRIPYGEKITKEKLNMVAQAEQILFDLGLRQCRVRMHGTMARIEILSEDFVRFLEEKVRKYVVWELKKLGFSYVSLDLLGYRSGSMNEVSGTEINFQPNMVVGLENLPP